MTDPKNALLEGIKVLEPMLLPCAFQFQLRGEGKGAGGYFAWGEFVRNDRRLELHFRHSLGLVTYHVAQERSSHETYMRELGVWNQCQYPGFSDNPKSPFQGLAHDLGFAEDFLSGPATVLRRAAEKQTEDAADAQNEFMAHAVGDVQTIERLREQFRQRKYREVLNLASELKYPGRMTESVRHMVELARRKTNA